MDLSRNSQLYISLQEVRRIVVSGSHGAAAGRGPAPGAGAAAVLRQVLPSVSGGSAAPELPGPSAFPQPHYPQNVGDGRRGQSGKGK